MTVQRYVHGYGERERERLRDQAGTLADLLHHDSIFPPGSSILEAGCGVGAQTVCLAGKNPLSRFTCVDISGESLDEAAARLHGWGNASFLQADIFDLPFPDGSFDHVIACFVLEHLQDPVKALKLLGRALKPGGTVTAIEGDHGSVFFHPDSIEAREAIRCQVELQASSGGNADIGRRLFPLLSEAGYGDVAVSPRMVYVDADKPALVEGFTKNTFIAMIEGIGDEVAARGMMTSEAWAKGIADLYRTTRPDGVFCYTFFKAVARNP
jgi:SAM-dependent methyltransferase